MDPISPNYPMTISDSLRQSLGDANLSLRLQAERARRDLKTFIMAAWSIVEPSEYLDGWHIAAIAAHLEAVTRGEIRKLLITIPPRHGKSLIASTMWPAWTWISNPQTRFLCSSYAESLSTRDAVRTRRLLTSPWYRSNWGDRFALTGDQNTKSRYENDRGGYRLSVGTGGSSTGEGGDVLLIDDPHNLADASSDDVRRGVLDWFDQVWSTRTNDPQHTPFVVIMQRHHELDLAGHLLEIGGWTHLNLPTLYEGTKTTTTIGWSDPRTRENELLWSARFGEQQVAEAQLTLGAYAFSAQHQQRPSPAAGGLVRREWLRYYDEMPPNLTDFTTAIDCSFKSGTLSDFCVAQIWARQSGKFFLLDQVRQRVDFPGTLKLVKTLLLRWPQAGRKVIEAAANGHALISSLQNEIPGVIPYVAKESKAARLSAVSPFLESGSVYLPAPKNHPWIEALIEELCMFPNGRNDDQVDALSMALSTLGSLWDFPVGLVPLTEEVMRSAIGPPRPNKKPPEEEKDTGRNWWPSRGGWINV